jgi:hypothetical protein
MNINIHYVWAGVIAWSALSLLATAFIRGASDRLDDSPKRKTKLGVQ